MIKYQDFSSKIAESIKSTVAPDTDVRKILPDDVTLRALKNLNGNSSKKILCRHTFKNAFSLYVDGPYGEKDLFHGDPDEIFAIIQHMQFARDFYK